MQLNPLTPEEERVIVHRGTEKPFSGEYDQLFAEGIYLCRHCGTPLYHSKNKFDAKCGWPSFDEEVFGAVEREPDPDGTRTEAVCARCKAHLGHVFEGENFTPANVRHCVNSVSLQFVPKDQIAKRKEVAYLAGGCFWCIEAMFRRLAGVLAAVLGYSGGTVDNPTYEQVSSGATGHAETTKIEYDPTLISYEGLLKIFFAIHDPTAINRQGNDVGPQYRSIIFYANDLQKEIAENHIRALEGRHVYQKPVATEVKPFTAFYEAEDYHRNYYENHKDAPYCQIVIAPKLEKLEKEYQKNLKP